MKTLLAVLILLSVSANAGAATTRHKPPAHASKSKFTCATAVKYCKQIRTCAEARFYMTQCGQAKLDRDGDGVPCENVCPGG